MQRTQFDERACAIARTINIIGEWWTPLIVRDLFYGVCRFDALRKHLGISRKVLTNRLNTLVENKIVERVPYQENPPRFEYRLTERGQDLLPILLTLKAWGDKWLNENGGQAESPVKLVDAETGEPLQPMLISMATGQPITPQSVDVVPGSESDEAEWVALQEAIAESKA